MPGAYNAEELQSRFDAIVRRFDWIEEYLVSLGQAVGRPYQTYTDSLNIPAEVVALVRAGKRLQAVQRYRQLTGGSVEQAVQLLAGL